MRRPTLLERAVAVAVAITGPALLAGGTAGAAPLPQPKADIVVDAGTGRVLVCDNVHQAMHPASTSKIMTALTAVERLKPDAPVTADAAAAAVESEKIGFPAGTTWPLDQMLSALMMVSANDAAYSIAHTAGGSLDGFAAMLNQTARELGLKDSILNDPAGLDDSTSFKGGPMMSAYDLAIAARNGLSVPAIATWSATRIHDFTDPQGVPHHFTNHNRMLPGGAYGYAGATGFKTGFTNQANHSLVATATRNGRTLIAVILGAPDAGYLEAASLLDASFASPPTTPATTCGGETLPPTRVSLYASRAADRDAFTKLGPTAGGGSGAATPAAPVVPAVIPQLSSAPRAPTPGNTTIVHHRSSGLFSARNVVLVLIVLAAITFFLRRRAVKRQRAMRMARRRQRRAAMRSGGLPVVDGRYRPGLRLGPPLESHVRVRTLDDSNTSLG